jgi:hypothetical protein
MVISSWDILSDCCGQQSGMRKAGQVFNLADEHFIVQQYILLIWLFLLLWNRASMRIL